MIEKRFQPLVALGVCAFLMVGTWFLTDITTTINYNMKVLEEKEILIAGDDVPLKYIQVEILSTGKTSMEDGTTKYTITAKINGPIIRFDYPFDVVVTKERHDEAVNLGKNRLWRGEGQKEG